MRKEGQFSKTLRIASVVRICCYDNSNLSSGALKFPPTRVSSRFSSTILWIAWSRCAFPRPTNMSIRNEFKILRPRRRPATSLQVLSLSRGAVMRFGRSLRKRKRSGWRQMTPTSSTWSIDWRTKAKTTTSWSTTLCSNSDRWLARRK